MSEPPAFLQSIPLCLDLSSLAWPLVFALLSLSHPFCLSLALFLREALCEFQVDHILCAILHNVLLPQGTRHNFNSIIVYFFNVYFPC